MQQSWKQNPDPPTPQSISFPQDDISYKNNLCPGSPSEKKSNF